MRYVAGICIIVISMNGAFQIFAVGWILTQNPEEPWIIAFGRVRYLTKMWPTLKELKVLLMLIAMAQYQASYVPWWVWFLSKMHPRLKTISTAPTKDPQRFWLQLGSLSFTDRCFETASESASESASDVSESVSAPLKSKHARSVITSYNTAWYV